MWYDKGCEYGDRVDWCRNYVQDASQCRRKELAAQCCQTCALITNSTVTTRKPTPSAPTTRAGPTEGKPPSTSFQLLYTVYDDIGSRSPPSDNKLDYCNSPDSNLTVSQLGRLSHTGFKIRNGSTIRYFRIFTKSLTTSLNLRVSIILSLFNSISAVVSLMLSTLLVHLYIPHSKLTTAPSAILNPVSGKNFLRNFANDANRLISCSPHHSYLISQILVQYIFYHHFHHPSLLLSSTPGSKLTFSINAAYHALVVSVIFSN